MKCRECCLSLSTLAGKTLTLKEGSPEVILDGEGSFYDKKHIDAKANFLFFLFFITND